MEISARQFTAVFVMALSTAFLTAACATAPGKLSDPTITQQIEKNHTTKADISRMIGAPQQTSTDSNGIEIWTYSEAVKNWASVVSFGLAPSNANVLIVKFKNDVVVDYEYSKNKALYGSFGQMN